jgi:hypothetical protein
MGGFSVLRVVDSITQLGSSDAGCVAVTGSHGGISGVNAAALSLGIDVGQRCRDSVVAIHRDISNSRPTGDTP